MNSKFTLVKMIVTSKISKRTKTIIESDKPLLNIITWEIKNDGIVPFLNFFTLDYLAPGLEFLNATREYNSSNNWNTGQILQWNNPSLDKKESMQFSYIQGVLFNQLVNFSIIPKTFRHRKRSVIEFGQPISMKIIEQDGTGALVITNPGSKDKIWNISIQFEPHHILKIYQM